MFLARVSSSSLFRGVALFLARVRAAVSRVLPRWPSSSAASARASLRRCVRFAVVSGHCGLAPICARGPNQSRMGAEQREAQDSSSASVLQDARPSGFRLDIVSVPASSPWSDAGLEFETVRKSWLAGFRSSRRTAAPSSAAAVAFVASVPLQKGLNRSRSLLNAVDAYRHQQKVTTATAPAPCPETRRDRSPSGPCPRSG